MLTATRVMVLQRNGYITFEDFVRFIRRGRDDCSMEEAARLAFEALDDGGDKYVGKVLGPTPWTMTRHDGPITSGCDEMLYPSIKWP